MESQESMMTESNQKRVALVHDFLVAYGGAERVFEELAALYPEAPIYTLVYDREQMGEHFRGRKVYTSWLGKLPRFLQRRYRWFLLFFPAAVESFDLREYDLVISSSGAWSKGIVTRLNTKHIAYLHSPMRYVWDYHEAYLKELSGWGIWHIVTRMVMSYLRIWDRQAAERPDVLIANSVFTQERIQKYYRREAQVIYPSVTLHERFPVSDDRPREYFLVVARLTRSKKIEAVIEAFNKLSLPLVVVGRGPEEKRLRKKAATTIRFVGFVSDDKLAFLYQGARALILPSEEDFGMVGVEALSFGAPVIGLEYGGLREIMTPGTMGETFRSAAPEIIAEAVKRFREKEEGHSRDVLRESAKRFSREQFRRNMIEVVAQQDRNKS